jgi:hypothetical protein
MQNVLAAACQTGTWQQKWDCGMHNNVNVGAATAHAAASFVPVLAVILVVLAVIAMARRSGRPASSKS